MLTYIIQIHEYLTNIIFHACSKEKNQLIDKNIVIMDLNDVKISIAV